MGGQACVLYGAAEFSRDTDLAPALWARRTTLALEGAGEVDLLSVPDLVASKKTQRDRDWPTIRRLVEVNYFTFRDEASAPRVRFWLRELRTPALLLEAAARFREMVPEVLPLRPLLAHAIAGRADELLDGLAREERAEREVDRAYWAPLRAELEVLRRKQRGEG